MSKSPDAFRTISEVADLLETPAHVLRFWESRFPQIRPVKRAGGRRYYRPADVALLTGIKRLLHEDGMTIRGVQKILREQGVRHVSGVADDSFDTEEDDDLVAELAKATGLPDLISTLPPAEAETAQIIALQTALRDPVTPPAPVPDMLPDTAEALSVPSAEAPPVEFPVPEEEAPWLSDTAAADDIAAPPPDDIPPGVTEPPPAVAPVRPVPVVADLFSRVAEPPPAPPVAEPVAEAPMAVWAEDSGTADRDATDPAPVLRITRIGPAPTPDALPPPPAKAEPAPVATGPTLAQRLRAIAATDLPPADRQRVSGIRAQALALRARLAGPARPPV